MKADIRFLKPEKTPQSFPSVNPVSAVVSAAPEVRGVYSVSVSSPGRGSFIRALVRHFPFKSLMYYYASPDSKEKKSPGSDAALAKGKRRDTSGGE